MRRHQVPTGRYVLLFVLGGSLAACAAETAGPAPGPEGGDETGTPRLAVFPDTMRIPQFDDQQISVNLLDGSDDVVPGVTFGYASDNEAIILVSPMERVRSVGPSGRANVTIDGGGLTRTIPIFVLAVPTAVSVSPAQVRVPQGRVTQMNVVVTDAIGDPIENPPLTFNSSNESVLVTSAAGEVIGVAQGSAIITVSCVDLRAQVPATVVDGAILASRWLGSRPFGAAVGSASVGLVTRLDTSRVSRIDVPAASAVLDVVVGALPTSVALHPDGQTAYVSNNVDRAVGVVDVAAGVQTGAIAINGNPFYVAVSPDGTQVIATANTDSVFVIDLVAAETMAAVAVGTAPNAIAFHPGQPLMYVSSFHGGTVAEISMETHTVLRTFTVGGVPQGLAVAADGSELYVANEQVGVQVWNVASGSLVTALGVGGSFELALSPDNATLAVTHPGLGRVTLIDRATRQIVRTIDTRGAPRRLAFHADGTILLIANEGGWVDLVPN